MGEGEGLNIYEVYSQNKSTYKSQFIGRLAATLLSLNQNNNNNLREINNIK